MNKLIYLLQVIMLVSCTTKLKENNHYSNCDSIIVDSIYGKGFWVEYFKEKKTQQGNIIKLQLISDSTFLVQWGRFSNLESIPDTFKLDGHETWLPVFEAESRDYILVKQHCGSACWTGYFLPLNKSLKFVKYHEYVAFDLDNFLVACVLDEKTIRVTDFKSGRYEDHNIDDSKGGFPNFDTISIKNRILIYKTELTRNSYKTEPILI